MSFLLLLNSLVQTYNYACSLDEEVMRLSLFLSDIDDTYLAAKSGLSYFDHAGQR
jgi:hypothetical protein